MPLPEITLRRMLSQKDAEHLLASFAGLLPGAPAAIIDTDGKTVAFQGNTPSVKEWSVQVGMALQGIGDNLTDQPVCMEGAVCYPLQLNQHTMGWLLMDNETPVGITLQSILALLLREKAEKRRLARETLDRYREVNLLYHLAERFGSSLEVGELLKITLSEVQRVIQADCGIVRLIHMDTPVEPQAANFGKEPDARLLEMFLYSLLEENSDIFTPNIISDVVVTLDGVQRMMVSILYAPLRVHEENLGLIVLGKDAGQPEFTAGDEKLLLALAGQAAVAIEKAGLHVKDLQHQQISQELAIGQRIQRSLLPKSMPVLPGWEFAASYQAANQVGGDFYDVFPLLGETDCQDVVYHGLTIADVAGKGIPAALMMAFAQGILHTAAYGKASPGEVLYQANRSILQSSHSGLLLTAFYAVLNPCTGELTYANAGHEPPLLYRAAIDAYEELNCGKNLLLGAQRDRTFREFSIQLEPGDLVLFYTDGVTEARNASGAFFAEEGLNAVLSQYAVSGCSVLLQAIGEALKQFTKNIAQSDDITMFAFRRIS